MKSPFLQKLIWAVLASMFVAHLAVRADDGSYADLIERGDYLVNRVGLCADCHTPRNEKGELVRELWLKGAPVGFKPMAEMPWSPVAPPIAGLPSMDDAQAMNFLTQGTRPDGSRPRPPMPEFRFDPADARAVLAYLRSLNR